jgi:hypothetical protein
VLVSGAGFFTLVCLLSSPMAVASGERTVELSAFRVIKRESGPVNYYSLAPGPQPYIHADYPVGAKTTVLGFRIPDDGRRAVGFLKWKWRALRLPRGGNECEESKGDSAAAVYVTWKRGLKWYSIKYVWSSVGPRGATCHRRRNLFRAQDTVIVESGPPLNEWRSVGLSLDREFRNHFENADARAEVPDLVGLGIMSDGDQTRSPSSADYADFVLGFR